MYDQTLLLREAQSFLVIILRLFRCWASIADGGTTLNQRLVFSIASVNILKATFDN